LQNEPKELSEDESRKFSWEGANERLFQAAGVTKKEARKRIAKGWDKADKDICKFHSEFSRGGHFLSNIFSNNQEEEAQVDQDESPVHESLLWITQIKT